MSDDIFKNMVVYDCETLKNFFSLAVIDVNTLVGYVFEISSRKDNSEEMFSYLDQLEKLKYKMVGFNNLGFDYPIIHFIYKHKNRLTPLKISNEAQNIINSLKENRFGKTIQVRFHRVYQIDLYKLNHMDNPAKATSLKALAASMRSRNVEEMSVDISKELTEEEMDSVIKYNINDVLVTLEFLKLNKDALVMRAELTKEYGKDFTNFSDSKIGSEIFIQELEKVKPESCFKYINGKRTMRQTKRPYINIKDCILPYIQFERPEFKALLEWFKKQVIKETKGVFSNLTEYQLGDLAQYARMVKKKSKKMDKEPTEQELAYARRENPFIEVEFNELKSGKKSYFFTWNEAEALNLVINNHEYIFGVGGIHSSVESQAIHSDEEWIIKDLDVIAYYPSIAISNTIFPNHLGIEFCEVYKDILEKRKLYPKNSPRNISYKLAANSIFGLSNNQFSPMLDPKYTMTVTIGGQLSLCMLLEMLMREVPSFQSIQSNTDGITIKLKRSDMDKCNIVVKEWEDLTGLKMEANIYKSMYILNVNNYFCVYENEKVKLKGCFDYNLALHQDPSSIVIQKAVEAHLTKNTPIEEFIRNHKDMFDFMIRAKIPRASSLVLTDSNGQETEQQNVSRFYASKGIGCGYLTKIMPPAKLKEEDRRIGILVGKTVKICNHVKDFQWDIDYDYYIEEANKLIEPFKEK